MNDMTISKLAKAGGVGVETLRYYQRRGLLGVPEKGVRGGNIRRYDAEHLQRLQFIKSAKTAGFTLDEIVDLIRLDAMSDRPRARIMARERIAALDIKIEQLKEARSALSKLAIECAKDTDGPCPILSAFDK